MKERQDQRTLLVATSDQESEYKKGSKSRARWSPIDQIEGRGYVKRIDMAPCQQSSRKVLATHIDGPKRFEEVA